MGSGVSLGRNKINPSEGNNARPGCKTIVEASAITVASNLQGAAEVQDSPRSLISDIHEVLSNTSPQQLPYSVPRRFSHNSTGSQLRSIESSPARESQAQSTPSRLSVASRGVLSSPSDPDQQGVADLFAQTAMSLGMDNDDLLFNMMYFDDGSGGTFGHMMNTVQQETLALHSESNTPYKLNPASEEAVTGLIKETYVPSLSSKMEGSQKSSKRCKEGEEDCCDQKECAVCRDYFEKGCAILRVPACKHFFHEDCLLKWSSLQAWCPICRSPLGVVHEIHPQSQADIRALTTVPEAAEVIAE
eukprot:gene10149-11232_t